MGRRPLPCEQGQHFGKWVVIEVFSTPRGREALCRCVCGDTKQVSVSSLANGKSTQCKACAARHPRLLLASQKFGRLTVLHPVGCPKRYQYWKCLCSCGNYTTAASSLLLRGTVRSCGCLTHRMGSDNPLWKGYEDLSQTYWGRLRAGALRRGLSFTLSKKQAWDIWCKQEQLCVLSGVQLEMSGGNPSASLDRIDPSSGYSLKNCQWVHKVINGMKWDIPNHTFQDLCGRCVKEGVPIPAFQWREPKRGSRWKGCGAISGSYWNKLRRNAALRGYPFELLIEDAWDLMVFQGGVGALSGLPVCKGIILTGSLDRIDNTKGYVKGNCHWVDPRINTMKGSLDLRCFLEWCQKVSDTVL